MDTSPAGESEVPPRNDRPIGGWLCQRNRIRRGKSFEGVQRKERLAFDQPLSRV